MSSTLTRSAALWIVVLLAATSLPAEAQISGLKKRVRGAIDRASDARGGAEAASTSGAANLYSDQVLEMTADVVARLDRAFAAEAAERDRIAALSASVKTPQDYMTCTMQANGSPEMAALMEDMTGKLQAASDRPGDAAARAAYQEAAQALTDFLGTQCGPDPERFESDLAQMQGLPAAAGVKAGGFNPTQYAMLRERIPPLCGIAHAVADGEVRIPGEGKDIYWIYSAEEVAAVVPRCDAFMAVLS